jgi:hypothetical protein
MTYSPKTPFEALLKPFDTLLQLCNMLIDSLFACTFPTLSNSLGAFFGTTDTEVLPTLRLLLTKRPPSPAMRVDFPTDNRFAGEQVMARI